MIIINRDKNGFSLNEIIYRGSGRRGRSRHKIFGDARKETILIGSVMLATALAIAVAMGTGTEANAASAPKLIKFKIVDENSIPQSLTGKKGDPVNGRKLAINRKKGNCLACHMMPIPEQSYHGKIGPDLNGVASRYEEGELRLRIVNPKIINEETIMPAFYRNDGFHRVMKKFNGKTIISAQDVEDIVAYLMTLK